MNAVENLKHYESRTVVEAISAGNGGQGVFFDSDLPSDYRWKDIECSGVIYKCSPVYNMGNDNLFVINGHLKAGDTVSFIPM